MFRITQDPSSVSTDSYLIKTTRNGPTVAARTHTTVPQYATKHRQRTQQAPLNHRV
jgi:hypothetical protein